LNYGYIADDGNSDVAAAMSEDMIIQAIKDFQVFAGLDPTGELDDETVNLMNTPRCGVKDKLSSEEEAKRKKRFALQGSRWNKDVLTYGITRYPTSRSWAKSEVDEAMDKGFQVWADHIPLKFKKQRSGRADIDIRFERGQHGDEGPQNAFDGPGGTLAHAFFPQYGGDAHFDDEEKWTKNEYRGTNMFQVAAHEFGHSLGLSHSDVNSALMAPFYKGYEPNFKLDQDDIDAIQKLYGVKVDEEDVRPPSPGPNPGSNDLCRDASFDTIFHTGDGSYYVFKGSNYWKLTEDSVEPGYPRKISWDWPGLPNNIDAAVTWSGNNLTTFFKGSQFWMFSNKEPLDGYPMEISQTAKGIPNNLDAAFQWSGNGKIYLFKNDQYWKFDPNREAGNRVAPNYPKKISNWDLPNNIDGATQWSNRKTYFFKNGKYYRFDDGNFTIDSSDDPFPRDAGKWWFGCQGKETRINGPNDVGFAGECPEPSYKYNEQSCCCGDYCCWDKCRWKDPPQECLNGIYKGKWVYDSAKEYYYAVGYGQ